MTGCDNTGFDKHDLEIKSCFDYQVLIIKFCLSGFDWEILFLFEAVYDKIKTRVEKFDIFFTTCLYIGTK